MSQRKNPPQVDKAGELFILMREVNAPRCSPTAARRIKRACDRLGLSADERLRVEMAKAAPIRVMKHGAPSSTEVAMVMDVGMFNAVTAALVEYAANHDGAEFEVHWTDEVNEMLAATGRA